MGEDHVHTTLPPIYVLYQNLKANGYETDKNWVLAGLGTLGHTAKSGKM